MPYESNTMLRELMRMRQRRLDAPLLPVAQLAGAAAGSSGGAHGRLDHAGEPPGWPRQGSVAGYLRSGQRGSQRTAAAGNAEEPIVLDDSSDEEERGAALGDRVCQGGAGPSGRAEPGGPGRAAAAAQASQPNALAGALAAGLAGLPGNRAGLRQGCDGDGGPGSGAAPRDPPWRVGSQAGSTGGSWPPLPQHAMRNAAGFAGLGCADAGPSARASQDRLHSGAGGNDAGGLGSQGSGGGLARRGSEHSGMVRAHGDTPLPSRVNEWAAEPGKDMLWTHSNRSRAWQAVNNYCR